MDARVPEKVMHRGSLPRSLASCSERVRCSSSRSVNAACGYSQTSSLPSATASSMSFSSFQRAESTIVASLTGSGLSETVERYRSRLRSTKANLRSYAWPICERCTSSISSACAKSLHAGFALSGSRKRTSLGEERSIKAAASFEMASVLSETNSGRRPTNLRCESARPSYEYTCTPVSLSTIAKWRGASLIVETGSLRSKMCGVFQLVTE
mmetsp:Transcript_3461/g.10830  ORF Transcript_3461/g.10830 Transcript_3461/m.10830 type:complete len:211 (+) Transcript_3461:1195-1827(+)